MAEKSLSNAFLDSLETFVSKIVSGESTDSIINTLLIIFVFIWVYLGLKVFFDARVRYKIGPAGQILFLIFGVITGPIGLFVYSLTKPKYTPEELDFIRIEHKFYHHQASKVLDCICCSAYVLEGHSFCTNCGTKNRFECEKCSTLTDYDDKYCYSCGVDFKGRKESILKNIRPLSNKTLNNYIEKKPTDDLNKLYSSIKDTLTKTVKKDSLKNEEYKSLKKASIKKDFADTDADLLNDESNKELSVNEIKSENINTPHKNKKKKKKKK